MFLPWMSVTQCMTKLLEHLTVTSSISGFPKTKIQPICILQQPRRQFPWSTGLRTLFLASFSLAILCDAIPCSELCFWIKVMPTAFITHQDVVKKAVTFDNMCSSNYKKTFSTEVCTPLSTIQETMDKDFPVPQTFHSLLDGMVPHSSLRYISVIVTCQFSWMNPLIFLCFSQYRQFTGNHYMLISNVLCSHF